MTGYYKNKMSNNAMLAYANGSMPRSKWTKSIIIDSLPDQIKPIAKQCYLDTLRYYFLIGDGYHHTGKYFNSTDFFCIDDNAIANFNPDELLQLNEQYIPQKETEFKLIYAFCKWGEWGGTRSHPKLIPHEGYCVLKDNWAYTEEMVKKKINGSHFEIVEKYERAPYGTAHTFNTIKHFFKLKKR